MYGQVIESMYTFNICNIFLFRLDEYTRINFKRVFLI